MMDSLPEIKLKTRRKLKHFSRVNALCWSTDSRTLASVSQDGRLIVWDTYTQSKLRNIHLQTGWVLGCDCSPSGRMVSTASLDGRCAVYNLLRRSNDHSVTQTLECSTNEPHVMYCCRFVDDAHILTSSDDSMCRLWDVEVGVCVREYAGHTSDVVCVSVAPDGRTFASGGCDTTTKIWDICSSALVHTFTSHTDDVNTVAYLSDGLALGTGSDDSTCRIFDIRSFGEFGCYASEGSDGVTSLGFSTSGRLMFVGMDSPHVVVWDTVQRSVVDVLSEHFSRVSGVGVSPDGRALATSSWDCTVRIWN